jgi:hypothetical protein
MVNAPQSFPDQQELWENHCPFQIHWEIFNIVEINSATEFSVSISLIRVKCDGRFKSIEIFLLSGNVFQLNGHKFFQSPDRESL